MDVAPAGVVLTDLEQRQIQGTEPPRHLGERSGHAAVTAEEDAVTGSHHRP
jgi:hypothetical protein